MGIELKAMDYSKFDSIVDSDDDTPSAAEQPRVQFPYAPPPKQQPQPAMAEAPEPGMQQIDPSTLDPEMQAKLGVSQIGSVDDVKKMRKQYKHGDQVVYEWEQNLTEIHIWVTPPPGVSAKMIEAKIEALHLTMGIKGVPDKYFNHDFPQKVRTDESFWTFEDGEIHFTLLKMSKAETWVGCFVGHDQLDPFSMQEVQKQIMRERFQEENPHFDFSGADFSGQCPDPRTFMGGVSYDPRATR